MKKLLLATFAFFEIGFYSNALAEDDERSNLKSNDASPINKQYNLKYNQKYTDGYYYYPTYYGNVYYPDEKEPVTTYRGNKSTAETERGGVNYYYQ